MNGKQKVDPEPPISCDAADAITAHTSTIVDSIIRIDTPSLAIPDIRAVSPVFAPGTLIIEDGTIVSHNAVGLCVRGFALTPPVLLCFALVQPQSPRRRFAGPNKQRRHR